MLNPFSGALFDAIPPDVWTESCPAAAVERVEDEALLYRQGSRNGSALVLLEGYVKLTRSEPGGAQFVSGILRRGEVFGPPLPGGGARETATAKGRIALYRLPIEELEALLARHPGAMAALARMLAARADLLARRLGSLLFKDVRSRLAEVLSELIGGLGGPCTHGHAVDIAFTQQELAEFVGASRPVVSTVLNGLRELKILDYDRRYICVDDLPALRRLGGLD